MVNIDEESNVIDDINLVVPDVDTDISSFTHQESNLSATEIELAKARDEAERRMFGNDGSNNEINVGEEKEDTKEKDELASTSIEEQINKDVIRQVYVKEDILRYPCTIVDFTSAKNMRVSILQQLRTVVMSDDEVKEVREGRLKYTQGNIEDLEQTLDTYVYTKYGDKVVLAGRINKNRSLRLIVNLLSQADIGEVDKDYSVLYAEKEGPFKRMNLQNSCDFILL